MAFTAAQFPVFNISRNIIFSQFARKCLMYKQLGFWINTKCNNIALYQNIFGNGLNKPIAFGYFRLAKKINKLSF